MKKWFWSRKASFRAFACDEAKLRLLSLNLRGQWTLELGHVAWNHSLARCSMVEDFPCVVRCESILWLRNDKQRSSDRVAVWNLNVTHCNGIQVHSLPSKWTLRLPLFSIKQQFPIQNHPYFHGLCNPFMINWGMVYYCFTKAAWLWWCWVSGLSTG